MEIINLPRGEMAADDVDCIHIARHDEGGFALTGSALVDCDDGTDAAESICLVSGQPYETEDAAEAAGLAWANGQCVSTLYVSRS